MNAFGKLLLATAAVMAPLSDAGAMTDADFAQLTPAQRKDLPLSVKLRFAKPMPDPPAGTSAAPADGVLLQSHASDGTTQAWAAPLAPPAAPSIQGASSFRSGPDATLPPPQQLDESGANVLPAGVDRRNGAARLHAPEQVAAVPLQPLYGTYDFPWSPISKLLIGFNGSYYVCSGALVNRYFLLTAGHCVYNHDPNEDGSTSDAQWADELYVFPGQTDLQPPYWSAGDPYSGMPEHPFGEANYQTEWAYNGWINNTDHNYDQAFVLIDRPMGDVTGWLGMETNTPVSSLNFSGYPVEQPYLPPNTLVQYPGYDAGNVSLYTDSTIEMNAYVYGGHSGGPVWRYDGVDQHRIQGMNSTSNRQGYASATRLTNQVFNDVAAQINTARTEYLYADLAEWTRWYQPTSHLYTPAVHPGETLIFDYSVGNVGFADSGPITTSFYLTTSDCFVTDGDCWIYQPVYYGYYLGSRQLPSLAGNNWYWPQEEIQLAPDAPPGIYWVAWYMSGTQPEYYSGGPGSCTPNCNNQAGIAATWVQVAGYDQLANMTAHGVSVAQRYTFQGSTIEVSGVVQNSGVFPTRPSATAILISPDDDCDPARSLVVAVIGTPAIDVGAEFDIDTVAFIPVDHPVGVAQVCVLADYFADVAESSKTDNAAHEQVYIDYGDEVFSAGFD